MAAGAEAQEQDAEAPGLWGPSIHMLWWWLVVGKDAPNEDGFAEDDAFYFPIHPAFKGSSI